MSKGEIGLYWWSRSDMVNLGDEMNRYVVEWVSGKRVRRASAETADMLAIGSVLNFVQKDIHLRRSPYLVWGSGTLGNSERTRSESFCISALRGPLSLSVMQGHRPVPFGDPGILSSEIWSASSENKYRWGVVPHYNHISKPWVSRVLDNTPNSVLIDVRDPDIAATMALISSCDFIASTSLHGLVIADSYEIPNVWLWDEAREPSGSWKYWDYFAGIGRRTKTAVSTTSISDLKSLEEKIGNLRHFGLLRAKKKEVYQAFPL